MQISSRFTIAIHLLICIETFKDTNKITSDFLAGSINVNPVIIRRILQQLKAADIVTVARGNVGNIEINRTIDDITFYDVYRAVDCVEEEGLFHFHEKPNPACPVGRNIHKALDNKLLKIQNVMEDEMRRTTIADVVQGTAELIHKENNEQENCTLI